MTDQELTELYLARSEEAIAATKEQYGAYCRAIAKNILTNQEDAEECLNDVWLRVWNAIPPQRPSSFKGWLGCVTRNCALSICRSRERCPQQVDEAFMELAEAFAGGPEEELEARELGRVISQFLWTQPQSARTAFLRHYWYCDTVEDAARRMGWSVSKMKSVLFRMRKKLKEHLKKEGYCYE